MILLAGIAPLRASSPPCSPADLAYAPDGASLAVLDATRKELVLIDAQSHQVTRRITFNGTPAGLTWLPDSTGLFVSESGNNRIVEVSTADGKFRRTVECGRYPMGLAHSPKHQSLLIADWGLNRLTVIHAGDGSVRAQIPVGIQPQAVAINPDESVAVVSALLPSGPANAADHAAEITLVDLQSLKATTSIRLPPGATGVRAIAIAADGRHAYITHLVGRYNLPTTQIDRGWVNTNAVSIIDLPGRKLLGTLLLDEVMRGAADPWGIAISQEYLHVALSGTHELAVVRLDVLPGLLAKGESLVNDLAALQRVQGIQRFPLPLLGPRGVALTPDGSQCAIAGYFSGNVVITDARGSQPRSIAIGEATEPGLERLGEIAFHDARTCFQQWLSCASCHPDARADGLNWDLLNDGIGNPKNARSMLWSDRTPPLMTLGVRSDLQAAIRAGFTHIQFTPPDDERVKQISAYFSSLKPVVSPHRNPDGSLTEAALRGKRLFEDRKVGCSNCHPAPLFTSLEAVNVGTAAACDQGASVFDTPSLIELWRTPPYLHHGQAATLRDVLITENPSDQHGNISHLDKTQIDDLIAYLLSL